MNTAINRENVQKILDRNAAERKEAALEAQARKLRIIINDNHTAKTAVKTAVEAPELPQEEPKEAAEALTRRQEKRAERDMEAAECHAWYQFMLRVFSPILIAALVIALAGHAPVSILVAFLMAAYTFLFAMLIIKAFSPLARLAAYFSRLFAEARKEIREIIHDFISKRKGGIVRG